MVTTMEQSESRSRTHDRNMARRLDAASWGLFFLWVGFALLAGISIGVGLLGIGAVTLLGQAARKAFGVPLEGFWILVGLAFVIGGLWIVYAVEVPLAPVLLLVVGAVLVLGAVLKRGGGDG